MRRISAVCERMSFLAYQIDLTRVLGVGRRCAASSASGNVLTWKERWSRDQTRERSLTSGARVGDKAQAFPIAIPWAYVHTVRLADANSIDHEDVLHKRSHVIHQHVLD